MIVENISNSQIVFVNLLGEGRNLIIAAKDKSNPLIPNKEMLSKLIDKSDNLRLIVNSPEELDMVSKMDSRAVAIVSFESNLPKTR